MLDKKPDAAKKGLSDLLAWQDANLPQDKTARDGAAAAAAMLKYRIDSLQSQLAKNPDDKKKAVPEGKGPTRAEWDAKSHTELETLLASQKARKGRIPLPDPAVIEALPAEARPQARRVNWTNVSMGYQPLLTKAWFDTMGTFQQEAKFDRVFSNSYFWVVTRSNDCFY